MQGIYQVKFAVLVYNFPPFEYEGRQTAFLPHNLKVE